MKDIQKILFTTATTLSLASAFVLVTGCSQGDKAAAPDAGSATAQGEQSAPQGEQPASTEQPAPVSTPQDGNGKKVTTETGLQYEEIVEGTGKSPKPGDSVTVHYTGWLTDGTKFDSSVDRGQPFPFTIGEGQVIRGWDEGVMTMKVGGKRKLTIPPNLAYGDAGAGDRIPPGSTLVFDVELIDVK